MNYASILLLVRPNYQEVARQLAMYGIIEHSTFQAKYLSFHLIRSDLSTYLRKTSSTKKPTMIYLSIRPSSHRKEDGLRTSTALSDKIANDKTIHYMRRDVCAVRHIHPIHISYVACRKKRET